MIKGGNKLPPFYFSFLTKFLMYFSFSLFARQRFFTSLPNWYCDYKSVLFTPKVPKERESTLPFSTLLRAWIKWLIAGRACTLAFAIVCLCIHAHGAKALVERL